MSSPSLSAILRRKLLRMILAPSLVLVVVLGLFIALRQYKVMQERNQSLTQSTGRYVQVYMEDAMQSLRHAALNRDMPHGESHTSLHLANFYASYPHFERLFLLDDAGDITAAYPSGLTGIDFPLPLTEAEGGVFSKPTYSPDTDSLVIYLSYPTADGGTIVAELSLEALRRHVREFAPRSEDSEIILTDAYGNVVVHPNETLVRQQANIGDWDIFRTPPAEEATTLLYRRGGSYHLGAIVSLPGLGWRLLMSTPLASVFLPVAQTIAGFLAFLAVFFGLVVAGLRYDLHRRIVAPLSNFAAALQLAARGDYTREAPSGQDTFSELEVMEREFVSMARKIAARERELRSSRAHIQSIVDSLSSALVSVDRGGRLRLVNATAAKLCGLPPEQAEGRDMYEAFPMLVQVRKQIGTTLALRRATTVERLPGQSGSHATYYDIGCYPMHDDEDGGAVIRIEDVTTRAQLEEIMIQTEKMMSVGGLAAGMAHEINNPLGGILQSAQNIERRTDPGLAANRDAAAEVGTDIGAVRAYMERRGILRMLAGIADSGRRAAAIVSNMLNFSRRSSSQHAPCDLHALIENVLVLASSEYDLKKRYDFRKIEIIKDFDPQLPPVPCTATEIEQVMLNLLKNAAQAMNSMVPPPPHPTLTISTRAAARHAEIRVRDNGPGIPREDRKRIFEPFFTTKAPGDGTGLGLSVSYFIVTNNHKGAFAVESEPGAGAEFIIRLPLDAPPAATATTG